MRVKERTRATCWFALILILAILPIASALPGTNVVWEVRSFNVSNGGDALPVVTLNYPPNNTITNNPIITFNCTAYDDIKLVNVTLYGNWSGGWHANETNSSGINNTYYIFVKNISEDGTYVWNCQACDNGSHCTFSSNRTFTIDITPPTTNASAKKEDGTTYNFGEWTNASYVNVTLNCSAPDCNITIYCTDTNNSCEPNQTYNGTPIQISTEGVTYLRYRSNDTLGNIEDTRNVTIKIDRTPPITNASAVDDFGASYTFGTWISASYVNVTFSCSDSLSGCNTTLYCISNTSCTPNQTYNGTPLKISEEGISYIKYKTNDTAGNWESVRNQTVMIDRTPPTIIITSPVNTTLTYIQAGMNLTVTYNYTELHPKNLSLYILDQTNTPIKVITFNESNLSNGTQTRTDQIPIPNNTPSGYYHVKIVIYDLAGNNGSAIQSNSVIITNETFDFYGVTYYPNGTEMNGTNVTIEIYQLPPYQGPSLVDSLSCLSDENGNFNLSNIMYHDTLLYKPIIRHFNGTALDYIGPSLPMLLARDLRNLGEVKFYLKPGATLNITAVNATNSPKKFNYLIKDTKLGYPVAEYFTPNPELAVNQAIVYVPADRNYSIMIYPFDSFPMSFDLNNLSGKPEQRDIKFNCTQEWKWVSGYAKYKGSANFTNLTIIAYLLEPGNMVSKEHPLPLNMGVWSSKNDTINPTKGFFNITLPATPNGMKLLLFANAEKNGTYYGGFKNITLTIGGNDTTINFTLHELVGVESILKVEKADGGIANISTKEFLFNLTNANGTPVKNAHIEVKLDYTPLNGSKFTFMADVSPESNGIFKLPLLNHSIDRINIFSPDFAPRKLSLKASDLANQSRTITLYPFKPGKPGGVEIKDISIEFIKHKDECEVPYPENCSLMPSENISEFNPLSVVMSGASLSLRIKTSNNITIHYVNVDLFASGPPDAVFDTNSSDIKGDIFAQVWRFGSLGPEIYDEVIIGIPYKEASQSQTGFNESSEINLSIPYLYDDDWNVIWNQSAGDNTTHISKNDTLKDFRDYLNSKYEAYLNGTGVVCNESDINLTGLCYKDTANNMLWFKIPHFSGIGPETKGDILKANLENCSSNSECAGGYCVHGYCWNAPTRCGDGYCDSGETHVNCPSDCPSTTGGTTGGGGGGGGISLPSLPRQSKLWTKITPGVATIMKITNKELGLKQIQIEVKNPANNVKITVTKLEGKPASVTQEISGKVYKYLEINAENLNETNLEEVKIQFEVNKTWILKNNLDKHRVYLYRFANNKWQKLTTRLLNETPNYINYEAETPGFSYFAIAGEEKICEEGAKRCSNNNLEQCINNKWQLVESCEYGCNSTLLACNPKPPEEIKKICEEGTRRCMDNYLQKCENGEWKIIESCEYGCNETTLTCNPKPEKPKEEFKPSKPREWLNWKLFAAIAVAVILILLLYFGRSKISEALSRITHSHKLAQKYKNLYIIMKANLNNGIKNLLLGKNSMNLPLKGLVSYLVIPLLLALPIIFFSASSATLFSQQSNECVNITLLSPANLTQTLINDSLNFTFISYSTTNTTYSCTLYIDDISCGTNSSVQNNTETTITANCSLSPGDHTWYINCTDADGTNQSEVRTIGIGANFSRCAVLVDSGTYYLNDSIINSSIPSCINITANNVILDCQGNTIDGDDATNYGIVVSRGSEETTNITIRDCTVTDWGTKAVYLRNADANTLENLVINSNPDDGIYLDHSHNNSLSNITANDNGVGIVLYYSDSNNLTNITAIGSGNGVEIYLSDFTILKNAELINNTCWDVKYDTDRNNKDCNSQFINVTGTDNKPIVFFNSSVHIKDWNNNVSEIILCGADYSVIDNLTMNHTDKKNNALILVATQHTNITNSVFANLYYGILGFRSDYNQLINITAVNNYISGLYLRHVDSNTFENISITGGSYGIFLDYYNDENTFSKITVKNCSANAIDVRNSHKNNFTDLVTEDNTYGIYIENSNSTIIKDSSITNSTTADIKFSPGKNHYITYLINTTFNKTNVTIAGNGTMVVKWYLDIYVNSTSGKSLSEANVTAWQKDGTQVFSELTNSSGCIQRKTLTEYIQNSSQIYPDNVTYYTPYIINASKEGYYVNSTQINLTQSLAAYITLKGIPPIIIWNVPKNDNSTVVVNGTLIHNITFVDENLYMVECVIYDSDGNIMWNSTPYNLTGNTSWTLTEEVNVSTWPDGIYYENCTVTDLD